MSGYQTQWTHQTALAAPYGVVLWVRMRLGGRIVQLSGMWGVQMSQWDGWASEGTWTHIEKVPVPEGLSHCVPSVTEPHNICAGH